MDATEDRALRGAGDFFAIDRNVWARVCGLGMNAAVAYLILARGTGGDNRTTTWSTNAIEKYTKIARYRAKSAIQDLVNSHLIEQRRGGSRPQYYLVPADEVDNPIKPAPELSGEEAGVLAVITKHANGVAVPKSRRDGDPWSVSNPYAVAVRLRDQGLIRRKLYPVNTFEVVPPRVRAKPDWIWLPNSLIEGAAKEVPPVEFIRQFGSNHVHALRLFVDLYHAQSLAVDGGIHWRMLRLEFSREKIGEYGSYNIWGFNKCNINCFGGSPLIAPYLTGKNEKIVDGDKIITRDSGYSIFFDAYARLRDGGLLFVVPHVVDSDTDEGEVICPYGLYGQRGAEAAEIEIGAAAHLAGHAMLNSRQRAAISGTGYWLLPAPKHQTDVQLVGLVRLRYRAQTKATAQWAGRAQEWAAAAAMYDSLREKAEKVVHLQSDATSKRRQG